MTIADKEKTMNYDEMSTEDLLKCKEKLERDAMILNNNQMSVKILLNSLYGAMSSQYFRYFDLRNAEAITLAGQMSIKWMEKATNEFMTKLLGEKGDWVCAIDTDSIYVNFEPLVKKFQLDKDRSTNEVCQLVNKMCVDQFEPMLARACQDLFEYTQSYENHLEMDREVIADVGFWTAKKRYVLNVLNKEGVQYDKPKLKIMGIEAIKSSTPAICRDYLKDSFKVILSGDERKAQEYIENFKKVFKQAGPEEIAFPRGVNDIIKWRDRENLYKKGCPIHVRAALLYNAELEKHNLKQHPSIKNGDKIKFLYMKKPNPIKENVFGFIDYLPKEMNLNRYIDYDTQFEKTFTSVLEPIFEAIGWNIEEKVSIEDFF